MLRTTTFFALGELRYYIEFYLPQSTKFKIYRIGKLAIIWSLEWLVRHSVLLFTSLVEQLEKKVRTGHFDRFLKINIYI